MTEHDSHIHDIQLQRDVVIKVLCAASGLDSDWIKVGQEIEQIKIVYYKNLAIASRSCVSCINTNNNIMTLKFGLEVTQCH